MSDPLSSVEIEDVLSSIRRLVSEDLRPVNRSAGLRRAEPEKLILTPALRVVAEVPQAGPAEAVADACGDEIAPEDAGQEDGVEVDGAPMLEVTAWRPTDWDTTDWHEPADLAVIAAPAEGWAQDDDASIISEPLPVHAEPVADAAWADQAEADVIATLAEPEFASETASDNEAVDEEGLNVNEAMLRDLVRDMIREELQGGLGERITRNVRKLVRQEIARTLAAHELE